MADIILVVVGLIIIVISFVISENEKDEDKEVPVPVMTRELLEESIDDLNDIITKRFDRKFEERWEETIADADDQMGQISNEKIMAVHDFSGEVLEKISQNHEDVIFLYKMLNDKEEELKQMALEIDRSRNDWQSFYQKQKQSEYEKQKNRGQEEQDGKVSQRREKIRIMDSLEGLSRRERLELLEAMDRGEIIADVEDLNPYEDVAKNLSPYGDAVENLSPYDDAVENLSSYGDVVGTSGDILEEEFLDDYISGPELISRQKEKMTAAASLSDNPEMQEDGNLEVQVSDAAKGEMPYSAQVQMPGAAEEEMPDSPKVQMQGIAKREIPDSPQVQAAKRSFNNLAERQAQKLRQEREEKEISHRMKAGNAAIFTGSNWNQEVLRLYKEGKSVQEISKLLKKGQGEVKLVLDLFQKAEEDS